MSSEEKNAAVRKSPSAVVSAAVCTVAAALLTACGGTQATPPANAVSSATPSAARASSSATPSAGTAPPLALRGDAATNTACALATPVEITQVAGGPVVMISGNSAHDLTTRLGRPDCTWIMAPRDGFQAPAVGIQLDKPNDVAQLRAYNDGLVTQGKAIAVPGLGDDAVASGVSVVVFRGGVVMTVAAHLHPLGIGYDQGRPIAIVVAQMVLPRLPG